MEPMVAAKIIKNLLEENKNSGYEKRKLNLSNGEIASLNKAIKVLKDEHSRNKSKKIKEE